MAEHVGFALSDVVISTNDSFRQVAIERGRRDPADVFVDEMGPTRRSFDLGREILRCGKQDST